MKSLYARACAIDSSWSSVNRTNSDKLGNMTAASTPPGFRPRMMSSASPSGVSPPNCRYLEMVQPSKPIVCSFLNSVCPPGTIGSSSVNSSSHRARSLSCRGSLVLNRSTGSMMWESPETTNSLNIGACLSSDFDVLSIYENQVLIEVSWTERSTSMEGRDAARALLPVAQPAARPARPAAGAGGRYRGGGG